MHSPTQALLWELWRTSRFELIVRIGGMCGFVLLMRSVVKDSSEPNAQFIRGVAVVMLMMTSVFSQTWLSTLDNSGNGFSFRLGFIRPVTTRTLVLLPMLFTASVAGACYLVPAWFFSVMMDSPIPLVTPAILGGLTSLCITSVTWSCVHRISRVIGLAILAALIVAALAAAAMNRDGEEVVLLALGNPATFRLPWPVWLGLGAISASALSLTISAVARQRHGDRWWPGSLLSRPSKLSLQSTSAAKRDRMRPFGSASAAQAWYELRRFGTTVLCLSLAAPLLIVAFLTAVRYLSSDWSFDVAVWSVAILICPLVYQFVGADGAIGLKVTQGNARLSLFDAARPLANDQLMTIKLLTVSAGSLIGGCIMCLFAATHTAFTGSSHQWSRLVSLLIEPVVEMNPLWWLAIISNLVLFCFASTSMLMAFGLWIPLHRKWPVIGACVFALHVWLLVLDAEQDWAYRAAWEIYACLLAIAIVWLTLLSVDRVLRSGAMRLPIFAVTVGLWLVHVGCAAVLYREAMSRHELDIPLSLLSLAFSLLFVPLTCFALAPLAYASHRHR